MRTIEVSAFDLAQRYVGMVMERQGDQDHPLIQWWLSLCGFGLDAHDEIPWCSAMVNGVAWQLRLPRSKSASARSWLGIGQQVELANMEVGFDVVIITRGQGKQPGPDILNAPGHVGLYAGHDERRIQLLGGNQGNTVSVASFPIDSFLGGRRLA